MLAHRLALELGCPDPNTVLESMTSEQLTSWHAFDRISPIGGQRMDYLFAYQTANIAGMLGTSKRRPRVEDFLIKWHTPAEEHQSQLKKAWSNVRQLWKRGDG